MKSIETRRRMSEAHKGKTLTEETKAKIRASKANISDETKAKMSKASKGIKKSEAHKAKMKLKQRYLANVFAFIRDTQQLSYREAKKLYSADKDYWTNQYEEKRND